MSTLNLFIRLFDLGSINDFMLFDLIILPIKTTKFDINRMIETIFLTFNNLAFVRKRVVSRRKNLISKFFLD